MSTGPATHPRWFWPVVAFIVAVAAFGAIGSMCGYDEAATAAFERWWHDDGRSTAGSK